MQRLEVSGAVRPIYGSLGAKRLNGSSVSITAGSIAGTDLFEWRAESSMIFPKFQVPSGNYFHVASIWLAQVRRNHKGSNQASKVGWTITPTLWRAKHFRCLCLSVSNRSQNLRKSTMFHNTCLTCQRFLKRHFVGVR